ncbi:hypothetical protein Cgig2_001220 [Carnegiea gigantea]|uniref:Uncharacterized protein n=1 Tax=Carnegiea gigantea TaxID=171969 RepID=A0A9Q1K067_9CARY|nr:hypothetical protein Cgig2_001220 [Carnegiea gigantea]
MDTRDSAYDRRRMNQGPDLSAGCADDSCSIAQGAGSAPTSGSRTSDVEPRTAVLDSLKQISERGSPSNLGQVSKAWEFCSVLVNASFSARSSIAVQSPFHTNSQQHPVMKTIACLPANSSLLRHLTAIGSIDSRALPFEALMLLVVILITEWGMPQALTGSGVQNFDVASCPYPTTYGSFVAEMPV